MIASISIANFRSLRKVDVSRLKAINIVTGKNGGGKTSFLEAMFLNCGGANASLALAINTFRGENFFSPDSDSQFRSMFYDFQFKNPIEIVTRQKIQAKLKDRSLRIESIVRNQPSTGKSSSEQFVSGLRFNFKGPSKPTIVGSVSMNKSLEMISQGALESRIVNLPINLEVPDNSELYYAQFVSPYIRDQNDIPNQINSVIKSKNMQRLISILNIVQPSINNIVSLHEHGRSVIYVDVGTSEYLPLFTLGSGFVHVLKIGLAIANVNKGIIIIDEIEDGLHFSIFESICRLLIEATNQADLQFIVATHSSEFLSAFISTTNNTNFDNFCLVNFSDGHSQPETTYYDNEEVRMADELKAELR